VVVVLPASMWAAMPMFLTRSKGKARATGCSLSVLGKGAQLYGFVKSQRLARTLTTKGLIAVVSERFIRFSHFMGFFPLTDSATSFIGGIH